MTTQQDATNYRVDSSSDTLRRRLLMSILPVVLIPFITATFIEYRQTTKRAIEEEYSKLQNKAFVGSNTITAFFQEAFKIDDLIAADDLVIEAMRLGNQKTQAQNLPLVPVEVLEEQFADTKLLLPNPEVNKYLKRVVQNTDITEIILTERNGLNVGYSNPTSDFVQRDESWWRNSLLKGKDIEEPEFDEMAREIVFAVSQEVKDPNTNMFLGMLRSAISLKLLNYRLISYLSDDSHDNEHEHEFDALQIYQPNSNSVITTITNEGFDSELSDVLGGEPIARAAESILNSIISRRSLAEIQEIIQQEPSFSQVRISQKQVDIDTAVFVQLEDENKIYIISNVPGTNLTTITSTDKSEIAAAGRSLLTTFSLTAVLLGAVSVITIVFLARQITKPLTELSATTQKLAAGDLDIQASPKGTVETKTLANNFNNLARQVKESLETQKALADKQRREKEQLEMEIVNLLNDVQDATDGDLTVRAKLDSLELSTVADLFNAIIDNLQEIAIEARDSTSKVGDSLKQNETAIRSLTEQAIAEARETRNTLMSVEQMSKSIQAVAQNANQAEQIVEDTYNTVVDSTQNMDLTVDSILTLRTTVGETAKKMKRLGESSQKISQTVSFIEEIALKTNILAINATVEAGRAGEYGEGFTIVAEQVAALAEQSAAATKEIAKIVAAIQAETTEVNQAMESGTTQVVETTRLVESTKERLGLVLKKSQQVNELIESISQSTVSQANTSQSVTDLMHKIALLSETTSQSSQQVAQSILETAEVAAKLQSTVSQFKVAQ